MSLSDIVRRPKAAEAPRPAPALAREPRVSLLPPELRAAEGVRRTRRRLIAGVVGAAVLVAAGITVSAGVVVTSQVALAIAAQQTRDLNRSVASYAAVSELQSRVQLTKVAERVGSSTAIDWKSYLARIDAVTPAAFTITGINLDSATPALAYTQGTTSLDGSRVGTIALTATADSLADVPAWLTGLATLPGYEDALPQTSTDAQGSGYTVVVTMHINDGAYITPLTQGVAK